VSTPRRCATSTPAGARRANSAAGAGTRASHTTTTPRADPPSASLFACHGQA
jgi:hypothetical protein